MHPIAQEQSKKTAGTMHMVVQLHSAGQNATRKKRNKNMGESGCRVTGCPMPFIRRHSGQGAGFGILVPKKKITKEASMLT